MQALGINNRKSNKIPIELLNLESHNTLCVPVHIAAC